MNNKLMDGYDVIQSYFAGHPAAKQTRYRVFRYEKPNVGKPIKVYKYGYPDYKSMIKKHPELE